MRRTTITLLTLLALAVSAGPATAATAWSEPVTLAAGAATGSPDEPATSVAASDGRVAVAWRADAQTILAATTSGAATGFAAPQTLAAQTAPVQAAAPALVAGPGGRFDAAWAVLGATSAGDAVRCATSAAGAAFSPCADPVFQAGSAGNWRVGGIRAAANAAGASAIAFEGPGSAGYDFSRPYAAAALPWAASSIDGNIGILGAGMPNRPRIAVGPGGTVAVAWGETVTNDYRPVKAAILPAPATRAIEAHVPTGEYDLTTAWIVARRKPGGIRAERLDGTGGQDLGEGADPQVEASASGATTAAWIAGGALHVADAAAEAFGAPQEVAGGVAEHRLVVAPDGMATVAWIGTDRSVRVRTRPAGAEAFGPVETVRTGETPARGLQAAADAADTLALVWQEGPTDAVRAAVRRVVAPSTPAGAEPQRTVAEPEPERRDPRIGDPVGDPEPRALPVGRPTLAVGRRVARKGTVTVRVANPAGRALRGTLALGWRVPASRPGRRAAARKRASRWAPAASTRHIALAPGEIRAITLRLNRAAGRALARAKRLEIRSSLAFIGDPRPVRASATLTELRQPAKHLARMSD